MSAHRSRLMASAGVYEYMNASRVYITGESPLVEQYAELCFAKNFLVFVNWNDRPSKSTGTVSRGIKTSSAVPASCALAIELTNTNIQQKRKNVEKLDKSLAQTAPLLSSSVTVSATEQSGWVQQRHRLVGIGALPSLIEQPLVEIAPTVHSPRETLDVVSRFYRTLGKEIEIVQDRVGMVLPRILCQLINESAFALMEDVASPADIDLAMKLGVNYPNGPFEWAEKIGMRQVYAVLDALMKDLGEDRYRISPLLRQMAFGGEWWKRN